MSKSLNKAMLIGRLGQDPELRYTASGKAISSFSIATDSSWKDADGNAQEQTTWHNIVAWGKLAEICGEWLKKGAKVYLEGRISNRSYDDKNGVKKYVSEIILDQMLMLGEKSGEKPSTGKEKPSSQKESSEPEKTDDLPF